MARLKLIRAGDFQPWLGAFETIRVLAGRPIQVDDHWRSLRRACAALGLKPPFEFGPLARSLPKADGRWRWIVTADGAAHSFQPERWNPPAGLALALSAVRVGSANLDARHKTLSYLTHWQARRENARGETLLLNERAEIAGGAMSNIFWVRRGRLITPAEDCGCRAGVVRGWILGELDVTLVHRRVAALDSADEIFVTNSMLGICPVVRWQNRRLRAGPVTRRLRDRYERMAREA